MKRTFLSLGIVIALMGCATITKFDQNTLDAATTLKGQTLDLLTHIQEPYATYASQVDALQNKIKSQVAYEKGKGVQDITTYNQWALIISPNHLLGKLLEEWKQGKSLSPSVTKDRVDMIADSFDQIITLEGAKIK